MEVKIGVQHAPREIVLESGQSAEEVERLVGEALAGKSQLLSLVDEHGRKILVPADRLAYVEIGEPGPAQGGLRRAVGLSPRAARVREGPAVLTAGPLSVSGAASRASGRAENPGRTTGDTVWGGLDSAGQG